MGHRGDLAVQCFEHQPDRRGSSVIRYNDQDAFSATASDRAGLGDDLSDLDVGEFARGSEPGHSIHRCTLAHNCLTRIKQIHTN
jgi:hypothetical protein